MKKLFITLALIAALTIAALASGMGYIDVQKVFFNYKEANKMQEDFGKKEQAYKEKIEKKQAELEKIKDDKDKYRDMRLKVQTELEEERDELLQLNQKMTTELKDKILLSVKKVARDYALDWVVDKQVMLYGGIDVTDWVVEDLNKKK
ncbi:MAG: OmpH family outer membrane protein [Candidatus Margulisiibacteriota bacterium]